MAPSSSRARFWGRSSRTSLGGAPGHRGPCPPAGRDMPPRILEAETPESLVIARGLFEEYAAALEVDLGFQHFAEELAGLPGEYIRPAGGLMLGFEGSEPVGCVAFRPVAPDIAEMKRLY